MRGILASPRYPDSIDGTETLVRSYGGTYTQEERRKSD